MRITSTHPIIAARAFVWLLLAAPASLVGQNEGNGGLVLELPANARALGLGNAFVLSGSEPDAIFYNPASLGQANGSSFSVARYSTAATALSASSTVSGFGFGIQAFTYAAPSTDLIANPIGIGDITSDNPVSVGELVGSVGYGSELFGFRVGVAAKWVHQRINGGRAATVAADVGVVRELGVLNVGIALQNIGPDMTVGPNDLPLPLRLGFGLSTDVEQLGPLDVALSTALFRQHDDGIMAGGGVEVGFWPIVGRTFTGRIGVLHEPHSGTVFLTFGGGISLDNVTGSYAYHAVSSPGSGHLANLRWR